MKAEQGGITTIAPEFGVWGVIYRVFKQYESGIGAG